MKSIRLLPIVIFASVALLLFKGIGLITDGAYVLVGAPAAIAASGGEAESHGATMEGAPEEVTLEDTNPTLGDTAPTLATKSEAAGAGGHGGASTEAAEGGAHGATAESADPAAHAPEGSSAEMSTEGGAVASAVPCPPTGSEFPSSEPLPPGAGPAVSEMPATDCVDAPPANATADAVAMTMDGEGKMVPLSELDGENNEAALLARLAERRAALDKFASDLEVRAALVEAAEQRLNERTAALKDLEAQIAALVDQKEAEKDAQFKAVVSMYETMKARDAAKIFDDLDTRVLLRVARAMNPKKMAPILAAMNATRAQELTSAMAADTPPPKVAAAGEDLANLPQIVGQ